MDHMSASPELVRRGSRHFDASSSTSSSSSSISTRNIKKRDRVYRRDQEDVDRIECSGRGCKSCTTGTVADCVAVCFCPFAVVNFLALALVKMPWSIGKKCFGIGKKRRQKRVEMKAKMMAFNAENVPVSGELTEMRAAGAGDQEEEDKSAEMEADLIWMEMGQLGFGRVSFHGIQSFGNSNSHNL
ncbi:unnamed protein product [Rhodiola kirilowii]